LERKRKKIFIGTGSKVRRIGSRNYDLTRDDVIAEGFPTYIVNGLLQDRRIASSNNRSDKSHSLLCGREDSLVFEILQLTCRRPVPVRQGGSPLIWFPVGDKQKCGVSRYR
jgi:hypothetical protein